MRRRAGTRASLRVLALALMLTTTGSALAEPLAATAASDSDAEAELLRKAREFDRVIHARHITREGLFLYVIHLDQIEEQLRDGTTPALADTPTYTGIFAAMSCLRSRVETGEERQAARADAERALAGLTFLSEVTGVPGLLARGIQRAPAPPLEQRDPRHRWFPGAAPHSEFVWRGDASQDQYANGLLPAIAACRGVFPEVTRRLARSTAEMLLRTRMQLIDPDGRRTRYGDLSPDANHGFNSIAKLTGYAVFALASALDPDDPRFREQQRELRDRYRVVATSVRTNLRILGITNYSNDMMAWHLYRTLAPLARRSGDPAWPDLHFGMYKSQARLEPDRIPYFDLLACALESGCSPEELRQARTALLAFPLEKRRLPHKPGLAQVPRSWIPGRKGHPRARDLVPMDLRPPDSFEWKSNPYRVESSVEPSTEYTGLDYLSAYWVYRFVRSGMGASDPQEDYL